MRLSAAFGHVSNGGLDETNPGAEMVAVMAGFPL
jgi:hypothetical protein